MYLYHFFFGFLGKTSFIPKDWISSSVQIANSQPRFSQYSLADSHLEVFFTYCITSVIYLLVFLDFTLGSLVCALGLISMIYVLPLSIFIFRSVKYLWGLPSVLHLYGITTVSEPHFNTFGWSSNHLKTWRSQSERNVQLEESPSYLFIFFTLYFPL